jgi:hypothetical protein
MAVLFNRMLKNKHPAVSQGDYWLEARGLERQEAKKRQKRFCFKLPSLLSSDIKRIYKSRTTPDHGLEARFFNPLLKPAAGPRPAFTAVWLKSSTPF